MLETQVEKAGVDVRRNTVVTPDTVDDIAPDVVLVAVGARRDAPPIPGADRAEVLSGDDLRALLCGDDPDVAKRKLGLAQRALLRVGGALGVTERPELVRELSRRWMPLGKRVVVVGGGLVGSELAEFLAERGRTVTVLEEGAHFATEMAPPRRWQVLHHLREHGVTLRSGVRVTSIDDAGVHVVSSAPGAEETADTNIADTHKEEQVVAADHVILAIGTTGDSSLTDALAATGREVHALGDCAGVGYIPGAMLSAARIARAI